MNSIELIIDVGRIVSFNEYLKAGIKKGKFGHYAFLYMNPDVREYKADIKDHIIKNYKELISSSPIIKKTSQFYIEWHYEVNSILKIDVSNINKIVEDSLFDAINSIMKLPKKKRINDVQVISSKMTKSNKNGPREIIKCTISLMEPI